MSPPLDWQEHPDPPPVSEPARAASTVSLNVVVREVGNGTFDWTIRADYGTGGNPQIGHGQQLATQALAMAEAEAFIVDRLRPGP